MILEVDVIAREEKRKEILVRNDRLATSPVYDSRGTKEKAIVCDNQPERSPVNESKGRLLEK